MAGIDRVCTVNFEEINILAVFFQIGDGPIFQRQ